MTDSGDPTLYFLCGKMAAGKSTRALELSRVHAAILWSQDEFLAALYPGEIRDVADYVRCATRLQAAVGPRIRDLLCRGHSLVLDFPANTEKQRAWFRTLLEGTGARHELHFVDVPDDVCKRQLRQRSAGLPVGSAWTTDAEFDRITAFFEPPETDEGFNVIHHRTTADVRA